MNVLIGSEIQSLLCDFAIQLTAQNKFRETCLCFYVFNIHIFHTLVGHFFRYMREKWLSYISLNKQTFVSSNISHGRNKLRASLEPPGIQSAR